MEKKNNGVRVFKLFGDSQSPNQEDMPGHIVLRKTRYPDEVEYERTLHSAKQKGVAVVIEGSEPSESEMRQIKKVYDEFGTVKVFRRKARSLSSEIVIKPSSFDVISGDLSNPNEMDELKSSLCNHISGLIEE